MGLLDTAFEVAAEIDLTELDLDRVIGETAEIREGVIQMTEKVKETVLEMWDSDEHPYETDTYRSSIKTEFEDKASGFFVGTVYTKDNKCFWIEYGAEHMPEFAPFARACTALGGSVTEDEELRYSNKGTNPGAAHRSMNVSA